MKLTIRLISKIILGGIICLSLVISGCKNSLSSVSVIQIPAKTSTIVKKPIVTDSDHPALIPTETSVPSQTTTSTPTLKPFILPIGPNLIYAGKNTEMKIFWQGKVDEPYILEWGSDSSYCTGRQLIEPYGEAKDLFAFTIPNLQPGQKILYRIVSGDYSSGGSFMTAPSDMSDKLKFFAYGDSQESPELHNEVAKQITDLVDKDPSYQSFTQFLGDFVTYGDMEESWMEELFSPKYSYIRKEFANIPVIPAIGNHEGGGLLFDRYFPYTYEAGHYRSFDYGPAHFILLDQYLPLIEGSPQYDWFKDDLIGSSKKWKFVVMHEPPWSAGGGHENNLFAQQVLHSMMVHYGVSAVLSGHNHYYSRAVVDGVQYLTIGTGGGTSYTPVSKYKVLVSKFMGTGFARFEIVGNTMDGWFMDSTGVERDHFTISK